MVVLIQKKQVLSSRLFFSARFFALFLALCFTVNQGWSNELQTPTQQAASQLTSQSTSQLMPEPTPQPRWQLGFALGGQNIAHYRGSDQRHTQLLPVPLVLYTGSFLKINRNGARGELFKTKRLELNLSADASLVGSADDNRARAGMPELDSAFELGPALSIRLSGPSLDDGWSLKLPARIVMTIGQGGLTQRGYVFNPRLSYKKPAIFSDWTAGFTLGALWGSESNHDYFYEVGAQYALPDRAAYDAKPGYAGAFSRVSLRRKAGDWFMGFYLRYDSIDGAVFDDSPLVKTPHFWAAGFGVGKVFWSSR